MAKDKGRRMLLEKKGERNASGIRKNYKNALGVYVLHEVRYFKKSILTPTVC